MAPSPRGHLSPGRPQSCACPSRATSCQAADCEAFPQPHLQAQRRLPSREAAAADRQPWYLRKLRCQAGPLGPRDLPSWVGSVPVSQAPSPIPPPRLLEIWKHKWPAVAVMWGRAVGHSSQESAQSHNSRQGRHRLKQVCLEGHSRHGLPPLPRADPTAARRQKGSHPGLAGAQESGLRTCDMEGRQARGGEGCSRQRRAKCPAQRICLNPQTDCRAGDRGGWPVPSTSHPHIKDWVGNSSQMLPFPASVLEVCLVVPAMSGSSSSVPQQDDPGHCHLPHVSREVDVGSRGGKGSRIRAPSGLREERSRRRSRT